MANKEEAVEKILKEPVFAGLSDQAEKVRRNLLVFSLISVAAVLWEVRLSPSASIFGFTFEGLTPPRILQGLALVTGFSLVHFIWMGWDSFMEWRLRITGTKLSLVTVGRSGSDIGDYPNDPRQSTLYAWWSTRSEQSPNSGQIQQYLEPQLQELREKLDAIQTDQMAYLSSIQQSHGALSTAMQRIVNELTSLQATFDSQRIPVSLQRFDRWYLLFQRSQNLRWLVLDIGLPILFSGYSLVLLFLQIAKQAT